MDGIRKTDVVVGVDGSPTSTAAALWAADEAARRGVRVVLLYAYVLYAYGSKGGALPGSVAWEEAEIDADQLLADATDAVQKAHPHLTIQSRQEREPAGTALLEITGKAGLTVIASQARHQSLETLIGSVATYTAEQAKGPVLILRGEAAAASGAGPVVVGVDGSVAADAAIDFALTAAHDRGVALHVVHVWDPSPVAGFRRVFHLQVDHQQADAEQLRDLTADVAGRAERHPGVDIRPAVRRGRAASALLEYATQQRAALLVVGARGAADGPDLGSTPRALLAHSDLPVAVIPGPTKG